MSEGVSEQLHTREVIAPAPAASLAVSPLFRSLDAAALESIAQEVSCRLLRGGETLFREGDEGDGLYVVAWGRLRAQRGAGAALEVLGEIGRGEAVGELALLTGAPRMATVCALRDTELLRLSRAAFERLVTRHPHIMLELTRLIVAREHQPDRWRQGRPITLALLPAARDVDIRHVSAQLVRALAQGRRVLHIDAERVRRFELDRGGTDGERSCAAWLHDQELVHDCIILDTVPGPPSWRSLALRQADRVLLVARGDNLDGIDPELVQHLRTDAGGATAPETELVLLHDRSRSLPARTAQWLDALPVRRHHHIDPKSVRDVARLARAVTDTATGLVLGGGGARGIAHLGVLKALEEADIAIDIVGGTSIGALIGAQLAAGSDSQRMISDTRAALVERGSLHDYTMPLMSLFEGRRYNRMLTSLFGERRIEDLPLPFFCVSTNLTRGEAMVHRSGPLCKWIAASTSVPGLIPPIFDGQEILVDGGVCNNLPLDVMQRATSGPLIAVNVSPKTELRLDREYPDILSPWRVLLSRVFPFGPPIRVPTLASILVRTVTLTPPHAAHGGRPADLTFEPPTSPFRLLDWHAFDQLVEIGYRCALETLEQRERSDMVSERSLT